MKALFTLLVLFLATSYCYPQSGWVLQNSGTNCNIYGINCIDNLNCWAAGDGNRSDIPKNDSSIVLHSSNGGFTWETQLFKTNVYPFSYGFIDISFFDNNNGCILGNSYYYSNYSYYTTNGGVKWEEIDTSYSNYLSKIQFVNIHTIWALSNNGTEIMCSTNNGKTWDKNFSDSTTFVNIYFLDSLNGWAIGGSIYHTSDGGKNWIAKTDTSLNISVEDVAFTDINTGWIIGWGSSIFKSTDGGNSWIKKVIDSSWIGLFQIKFPDKNHGWILGVAGTRWHDKPLLYKTTNGGADWQKDNNFPKDSIYTIAFSDSLNGWAVGLHGHIWHTTTGGVSFVNDNSVNAIDPNIAISPNPAQDIVSAKCNVPIPPNAKMELYSSEGLLIKDLKATDFIGKQQFQFSVEELPTGIYFLKMSYSGGVHAYPVCIMK